MNHLIWRLHRTQAMVVAGGFAVLAVLLLVTGISMANTYSAALASCGATHSCADLPRLLFKGDGAIISLVSATVFLPGLLGMFWGAPLVASEFEAGTHDLAWTQSVTRRRWMSSNLAWALLLALLWGALMAALVSWWRVPENALFNRFDPVRFDIQGVVPIAYSVFAMALGIAAGVCFRRILPALVTTLGVFLGVRALIMLVIRPHFMTAIKASVPVIQSNVASIAHSWTLGDYLASPSGQSTQTGLALPASCKSAVFNGNESLLTCLARNHYHRLVTYQPAGRFWTFQAIETAIFLALAGALAAFAYRRVTSADA